MTSHRSTTANLTRRNLGRVLFVCLLAIGSLPAAADSPSYPPVRFDTGQIIEGIGSFVIPTDVLMAHTPFGLSSTVTLNGNIVEMCLSRRLKHGTTPIVVPGGASMPALLAGDYVLEFSESITWDDDPTAPCEHKETRPFTVIPQGNYIDAVEYYNASLDHYFITADPDERHVLDQGTIPGWTPTLVSFRVFKPDAPTSRDLAPVCRYYGRPEAGIDSHFYSASASDCAYVAQTWPDSWQLETTDAFKVIPNASCGAFDTQVVRFYNNRSNANHRYVKISTVGFGGPTMYDSMRAQGWLPEGDAWCVVECTTFDANGTCSAP